MQDNVTRRKLVGRAAVVALIGTGIGTIGTSARPGGIPGRPKVPICHRTRSGTWLYKMVPEPAVVGHKKHGDIVDGVTSPEFCAAQPPAPPRRG